MRVIFVCTGNTCRSPMAEAIFKDKFKEHTFISRGLFVPEKCGASFNSVEAMREMGLDITNHISCQLSENDVNDCDLILTMTKSQRDKIRAVCPEHSGKIYTLCEYSGVDGEIDDPYGGSESVYRSCAYKILQTAEEIDFDKRSDMRR